jgi:hypothetical protein
MLNSLALLIKPHPAVHTLATLRPGAGSEKRQLAIEHDIKPVKARTPTGLLVTWGVGLVICTLSQWT